MAGGLTAALLVLIAIAVVVVNRGSGKKPADGSNRTTASARGDAAEPNSNPETDPSPIVTTGKEPQTIADPPQAAPAAAPKSAAAMKPNSLPAVGKWLDATRQKGGLRDIVGLGVGKAWLDNVAGKPAVLNVEIQISNRSRDETLEFSGWRPDNQPQSESQASMIDDAGARLRAASARPALSRRAARRRIAPGESATEQLSFVFPDNESQHFRLALPYAALGQTGYLGFELPRQMIKREAADAEEAPQGVAGEPAPETLLPAGKTVKSKPGEPATIDDLPSAIERAAGIQTDAMHGPPKPAADKPSAPETTPQPEPEKVPDIRKLIEEEDRKPAAKDEAQPGRNEMEGPKSP